jgi:tetratricopeptide (TPR) repeat protein
MDFPHQIIVPLMFIIALLINFINRAINPPGGNTKNGKVPEVFGIVPADNSPTSVVIANDAAEFIKEIGKGQIAIIPFLFYDLKPTLEIVTQAMVRDIFGNEIHSVALSEPTPYEQSNLKGYEFKIVPRMNFEQGFLRILMGERLAYCIIVFYSGSNPQKLVNYANNITFNEPKFIDTGRFSHSRIHHNISYVNSTGLIYHQLGQLSEALRCFKKALDLAISYEINQSSAVYFKNILVALLDLREYSEILLTIKENLSHSFSQSPGVALIEAQALHFTGESEKAEKILEDLKNKKQLNNESDFIVFMNFLIDTNQKPRAIDECRDFLSHTNSIQIKLHLINLLQSQDLHKEAIETLQSEETRMALDTRLGLLWIDSYLATGEFQKGLEIVAKLKKLGLNTDLFYYKTGLLYAASGDYEQSRNSFQSAYEISPNNEEIKHALERVSGFLGRGNNSAIQEEILPVSSPDLPKIRTDIVFPAEEEPDALFEEIGRAIFFKDNEKTLITEKTRIKILRSRGIQSFSSYSFPYDSLFEKIYINEIKVTDSEGNVFSPARDSFYVQDDQEASYKKNVIVPLPGVSTGCTIDILITRRTLSTQEVIPFHEFQIIRAYPVQLGYLSITGDYQNVNYQSNRFFTHETSFQNGICLTAENIPPYHFEPRQISPEELYPFARICDHRTDIKNEVQSYFNQIGHTFAVSDPILSRAKELTNGLNTIEEKVKALYEFVNKHMRYTAIEFGVRGLKPAEAGDSLIKGYGDCKDHSVLLKSLLGAVNIESTLVLIQTAFSADPNIKSLDQFNHMILYIPVLDRFLDPTQKLTGFDCTVPLSLGNKNSLLLDPENPEFKFIPDYSSLISDVSISRFISDANDNILNVKEYVEISKYYSVFFRSDLQQIPPSQRENILRNRILLPVRSRIDHFALINEEKIDQPVKIEINYSYPANATSMPDNSMTFHIPHHWETMYLGLGNSGRRKTPFQIEYPLNVFSKTIIDNTLNLSPDHQIQNLAKQSPFGSYTFEYKTEQEKQNHQIEFNASVCSGTYLPEQQSDMEKWFMDSLIPLANPFTRSHNK